MNEAQILEMVLKARTSIGLPFRIEETEANLAGVVSTLRGYVTDFLNDEEQRVPVQWSSDGRAVLPVNPDYNLVIRNYFSYGQNLQAAVPDPPDNDANPPQG